MDMKSFIQKYYPSIISFVIASVLGVLFHFLHDWLPNLNFIKPFVAIDESIFEHLKLLFYPVIFVTISRLSWNTLEKIVDSISLMLYNNIKKYILILIN